MVMRPDEVPMWRKINGKTPCPMLPKPTKTILPAKFTCTISFASLVCRPLGALSPVGGGPPAYLAVSEISAFTPMRGVGPLVAGKRFDAMNPARERGIVALHGQKARAQFRGRASVQRAAQHLYPGENHHVGGRIVRPHDPLLLAQATLDGARLARHDMHGVGQFVDVFAYRIAED